MKKHENADEGIRTGHTQKKNTDSQLIHKRCSSPPVFKIFKLKALHLGKIKKRGNTDVGKRFLSEPQVGV